MRTFNKREKEIIAHLLQAGDKSQPIQIDKILETFFFKEEQGRALIIQNLGEYAVFFMKTEVFDDKEQRDKEVKHLLELIALLNFLDKSGYITIYRHVTEKLHYIQDYFDAPRVVNNTLFLNTKGYYSSAPDTILDGNKNTIYKGIIFRDYHYKLILDTTVGNLLVSESLTTLLNAPESPTVSLNTDKKKEVVINKNKKKMNNSLFQYLILFFMLLSFSTTMVVVYLFYYRMDVNEQNLLHIFSEYKILTDSLMAENMRVIEMENATPEAVEKAYYGIDISKFNRDIVPEITLHDSITFVICKATEGITYTDPYFYSNFDFIRSGDYLLGVYHFYRAQDKGEKQADFFWKTISRQGKIDIAPVVDIEQESLPANKEIDAVELQTEILACLQRLEEITKRIPIIYTNRPFADEYLNDNRFSNYPLWIADYVHQDAPLLPKTWKNIGYKIWQKNNNHSIGSHIADLDVFFGKLEDLTK